MSSIFSSLAQTFSGSIVDIPENGRPSTAPEFTRQSGQAALDNVNIPSGDFVQAIEKLAPKVRTRVILKVVRDNGFEDLKARLGLGTSKVEDRTDNQDSTLVAYAIMGAGFFEKDFSFLYECLSHPSIKVRKLAINHVCRVEKNTEKLAIAVLEAPKGMRREFYLQIQKHRRTLIANAVIERVNDLFGAEEATKIVSICTRDVVALMLPKIQQNIISWTSLVKFHADTVLEYLRSELLNTAPRLIVPFFRAKDTVLFKLMKYGHADDVLQLHLDFYPNAERLMSKVVKGLTYALPQSSDLVFDVLTRNKNNVQSFPMELAHGRKPHCFSDAQLQVLLSASSSYQVTLVLKHLPMSRRMAVYQNYLGEAKAATFQTPTEILMLLPIEQRIQETQRIISMTVVKNNPATMLRYLPYLEKDESNSRILDLSRDSKAERRAQAYNALVSSYVANKIDTAPLFSYLAKRLKNETDPIKATVLQHLTSNKVHESITIDQMDEIENLVDSILNSEDAGTAIYPIQTFIQNILQNFFYKYGPDSEETLRLQNVYLNCANYYNSSYIRKKRGCIDFVDVPQYPWRVPEYITTEERVEYMKAFWPQLECISTLYDSRYSNMLNFLDSLGAKTMCKTDEWDNAVIEILNSCSEYYTRATAARLYLTNFDLRESRVVQLLAKHEDILAASITPLLKHIAFYRPDLLTKKMLEVPNYTGKFVYSSYNGTTFEVPRLITDHHNKWSHQQRRWWLDFKLQKIKVNSSSSWNVKNTAEAFVGRFKFFVRQDVEFMLKDYPGETMINELGYRLLSKVDKPMETVDILTSAANTESAKVAMYCFPRIARVIERSQLQDAVMSLLDQAPDGMGLKITVHKECVRLLGEHACDVDLLIQEWAKPKLHRDTRVAIVHALRKLMAYDQTWEVLEQVANHEDGVISRSLLNQRRRETPANFIDRYVQLLLKLTSSTRTETRREVFSRLPGWSEGIESEVGSLCIDRIVDMTDCNEWGTAMECLVEVGRDGQISEQWEQAICDLIDPGRTDNTNNATPHRDVPHIQRAVEFFNKVARLPQDSRFELHSILMDITSKASQVDMGIKNLTVKTTMSCTSADDMGAYLVEMSRQCVAEPENFLLISDVFTAIQTHVDFKIKQPYTDILRTLMDASEKDPKTQDIIQLFAAAVVRRAGQVLGWSEDLNQTLRTLRTSENTSVRSIALFGTNTAFEQTYQKQYDF